MASSADRIKMLELSLANDDALIISDIETNRKGISYSIDTVNNLQLQFKDSAELFLIIGFDAFCEIDTWKSYKDFFSKVSFIIMTRPFLNYNDNNLIKNTIENCLKLKISDKYSYNDIKNCFFHETKKTVYLAEVTMLNISSTTIRNLIKQKLSIKYLVTEKVNDFIIAKGLYK